MAARRLFWELVAQHARWSSRWSPWALDALSVLNRTIDRAERLRSDLAPAPVVAVATGTFDAEAAIRSANVLINATAVGWKRGELALESELIAALAADTLVVDITYRDTDLLEAARARGLRTVDGLEMLVFQGARSLEIWTGRDSASRHHDGGRTRGTSCSIVTPILLAMVIVGIVLAAILWNLSEIGLGLNARQLQPACAHCMAALPATTWLPLYGFFTAWRCKSCGARQPRSRLVWEARRSRVLFPARLAVGRIPATSLRRDFRSAASPDPDHRSARKCALSQQHRARVRRSSDPGVHRWSARHGIGHGRTDRWCCDQPLPSLRFLAGSFAA